MAVMKARTTANATASTATSCYNRSHITVKSSNETIKDDQYTENGASLSSSSASSSASLSSNHDPNNNNNATTTTTTTKKSLYTEHKNDLPTWRDFLRLQPWVLVQGGSMGGYFDFVPEAWRVGPWSTMAVMYLTFILLGTITCTWYLFFGSSSPNHWEAYLPILYGTTSELDQHDHGYSSTLSWKDLRFLYNAATFGWMIYIMYLLVETPRGIFVWATYTVQSWTLLAFRHGLCALAVILPTSSSSARQFVHALIELTRFPMVCSTTITFVVWNFCVMPFMYYVLLKDAEPQRRRGFIQFCFSFRLVNIHLLNLVFCCINALWSCPLPPRPLVSLDFYWAFLSMVVYMAFYLLIMDRLGIHLYPVFSPRTKGIMVVGMWTLLLGLYGGTFLLWQHVLESLLSTPRK